MQRERSSRQAGETNPWDRTLIHPSNKNNRDGLGYIYLAEREGWRAKARVTNPRRSNPFH